MPADLQPFLSFALQRLPREEPFTCQHGKPRIVSHGFGFSKFDPPLIAIILMGNLPGAKRDEMLFDAAYRKCAIRGEI